MSKEKNLEAILVICLALIVFYLILDIRILLLISVILGLASLFIPFVAKWVAKEIGFISDVSTSGQNK